MEVWSKPIIPKGSFAIAFLQLDNHGDPTPVSAVAKDIGLTSQGGYGVTNGFTGESVMTVAPDTLLKILVNPNGVVLFKATVV